MTEEPGAPPKDLAPAEPASHHRGEIDAGGGPENGVVHTAECAAQRLPPGPSKGDGEGGATDGQADEETDDPTDGSAHDRSLYTRDSAHAAKRSVRFAVWRRPQSPRPVQRAFSSGSLARRYRGCLPACKRPAPRSGYPLGMVGAQHPAPAVLGRGAAAP